MAGIYIHVPFCKRICSYCDFYKSTIIDFIPGYLSAVKLELESRKNYLQNEPVETIYFGGGTPSIVSCDEIEEIIVLIHRIYPVSEGCEITLEANPDDLTVDYLYKLRHTHINRLSIGIQSFNNRDLKFLNRRHDASQAITCIADAKKAGYRNISVDLIYGIPGMSEEEWIRNLTFLPDVEHLSAYHLTFEPGTQLFRKAKEGLLHIPAEDVSNSQFFALRKFADDRKMIHYEISNLAKDGSYSRHNMAYWQGKKYLGVGPSAHSYDQRSRQWNLKDIRKYIDHLHKGIPVHEKEELSETDHFNEYVMVSLRTVWGINQIAVYDRFGPENHSRLLKFIEPFITSGHIISEGGTYKMTAHGWLISDHILAKLMI